MELISHDAPQTKQCPTCPQFGRPATQPRDAFQDHPTSRDGKRKSCAQCYHDGLPTWAAQRVASTKPTGVCECCREPERLRDEHGFPRRLSGYKLLGTTVEAAICLGCLNIIQQSGASLVALAKVMAFLAHGMVEPGRIATLVLERHDP